MFFIYTVDKTETGVTVTNDKGSYNDVREAGDTIQLIKDNMNYTELSCVKCKLRFL